ncbi:MAG: mechanosensitive ion channel family protein [Planctomycetota bacterium]
MADPAAATTADAPVPPTTRPGTEARTVPNPADLIERSADQLPEPVAWVIEKLIELSSPQVFATAVVLVLAVLVYTLVRRMLVRLRDQSHLDESLVGALRVVARWLFVLLTLAAMLQVWGVLNQLWAALTAAVTLVAIGFVAVWSVLSNVLCSLILIGTRPFRIGQRIALPPDEQLEGVVLHVTLLHTVLRTDEGDRLKIPNNLFFQRTLRIYGPNAKAKKAAAKADPPPDPPPVPEADDAEPT